MPELVEEIDYINEQLERLYGREPQADYLPRFRVVFSHDQFEKRWMTHTDEGFELLYPEVREVPKYRHYITEKYVLERLVPVDPRNTDLTTKVSYEPAHVFMDSKHNYLPPRLDMCRVVCDALLITAGERPRNLAKYRDPEIDPEYRNKELQRMMKEIFGNETDTMDAVHYKEGIVNPAGQMEFHEQQKSSVESKTENKKVD